MMIRIFVATMMLILCFSGSSGAGGAKSPVSNAGPLYQNDFEKVPVGKVPQDFLILNGNFKVVKDEANSALELPGEPVESFGLLFGPTETTGIAVQARIAATSHGRRSPMFGVGLNGVAGYKLRVAPGKGTLELVRDDEVKASVPYNWKSGTWTVFRIQTTRVKAGLWRVEGKAWAEGGDEPKEWMVSWEDKEEPPSGRPSLWGAPYSETPILFDDLMVTATKP